MSYRFDITDQWTPADGKCSVLADGRPGSARIGACGGLQAASVITA